MANSQGNLSIRLGDREDEIELMMELSGFSNQPTAFFLHLFDLHRNNLSTYHIIKNVMERNHDD